MGLQGDQVFDQLQKTLNFWESLRIFWNFFKKMKKSVFHVNAWTRWIAGAHHGELSEVLPWNTITKMFDQKLKP